MKPRTAAGEKALLKMSEKAAGILSILITRTMIHADTYKNAISGTVFSETLATARVPEKIIIPERTTKKMIYIC